MEVDFGLPPGESEARAMGTLRITGPELVPASQATVAVRTGIQITTVTAARIRSAR
jgi:hypothetical protein